MAAEISIWSNRPVRSEFTIPGSGALSSLVWGTGPVEFVCLHGARQNAGTWLALAEALERSTLAVDLPGHGRSYWREDRDYWPSANADAVAQLVSATAPCSSVVVGASLGGLSAITFAARHPGLVKRLAVLDIAPDTPLTPRQRPVAEFGGSEVFSSLEAMEEVATARADSRDKSRVERLVRSSARQRPDGQWEWTYDQLLRPNEMPQDMSHVWTDLAGLRCPVLMITGERSSYVSDDGVRELQARVPNVRFEVVAGAGHSIHTERPAELAALLLSFASAT